MKMFVGSNSNKYGSINPTSASNLSAFGATKSMMSSLSSVKSMFGFGRASVVTKALFETAPTEKKEEGNALEGMPFEEMRKQVIDSIV